MLYRIDPSQAAGAATINYGLFLNTVIDFVIVAFVIFLLVRQINRLQRQEEAPPPPATRECPQCAMMIPVRPVASTKRPFSLRKR